MTARLKLFLLKHRVRLVAISAGLLLIKEIVVGVEPLSYAGPVEPWGVVALLVTLAGTALRSWAAGVVHKRETLAQSGPYALTRHPLYIGSFLIAFGLVAIAHSGWEDYVIVTAIIILLYLPKINEEEGLISAQFGEEWRAFARRTGIWGPKRLPLELGASWTAAQWMRNREYRCLWVVVALLVGLELLRRFPLPALV